MKKINYKKVLASNEFELELLASILKKRFEIFPNKIVYWVRARILDNFYVLHVPLLILGSNPFLNLLLFSKVF